MRGNVRSVSAVSTVSSIILVLQCPAAAAAEETESKGKFFPPNFEQGSGASSIPEQPLSVYRVESLLGG
jgi:hypothetical protein